MARIFPRFYVFFLAPWEWLGLLRWRARVEGKKHLGDGRATKNRHLPMSMLGRMRLGAQIV